MKYLVVLAAVCLLIVPSQLYGQQISPNPNPAGNTITVDTSGAYNESDFFLNNGTIDITNDGELDNYETLTNNNVLTNDGLLNNWKFLTNYGTMNNNYGSKIENRATGNLFNDGTIAIAGTLVNSGTWNNSGLLINSGMLTNVGTLTNERSGTLTNNGTMDTTYAYFVNNGLLNGSGHIIGSYTDHGITKPGNSSGVMTIDGDYFKRAGSKEIELGGLFDGDGYNSLTEFDWIDVTGNVELAGLLNVELIDGFELHRGNWFEILRVGGTLTGQYDGLGEGDLVGHFGGQDLFITYGGGDGNDVALFTNAVPEPTTVLIWSMLAGLGMTVRRRR